MLRFNDYLRAARQDGRVAARLGDAAAGVATLVAILLCGHAPAARADSLSAALPHNLADRALSVTGQQPFGMTLVESVLVMRHGVRPPTSTAKFQTFAADPFPTWDVPDGNLTGHGAAAITVFGGVQRSIYAAAGLLSPSGCPANGDLLIWGDNADERTEASAVALAAGMYPGCALQYPLFSSSTSTLDPLFSPNFALDTNAATNAVLARMGGSFAPLQQATQGLMGAMGDVLQCCSVSLCQDQLGTASCGFGDLPWSLSGTGNKLSLNGPLSNGSGIAEVFQLEYMNGFSPDQVGFGRASSASAVTNLMKLYTLKYGYFDRTPILATNKGSNIAQQILDAILQGAGVTPLDGGPPPARLTVYVGHDSTIAALAGMLDLHWRLPGYQSDDMPPGGAFGFELLSDTSNNLYVRPVYMTQTLDQVRADAPSQSTGAPIYESLQLQGCEMDNGRLCTLDTFVDIMQAAIDPTATLPAVYQ